MLVRHAVGYERRVTREAERGALGRREHTSRLELEGGLDCAPLHPRALGGVGRVRLAVAAARHVARHVGDQLLQIRGQHTPAEHGPREPRERLQQLRPAAHREHAVGDEAHARLDHLEERLEPRELVSGERLDVRHRDSSCGDGPLGAS